MDEFASDALASDDAPLDRESVVTELEQLGVVGVGPADEWEAEIARELEDLGVVAEEGVEKTDDQQWEDEIERMLEMHSDNN